MTISQDVAALIDYTTSSEVMNPPQSAAGGCEAGNLNMEQRDRALGQSSKGNVHDRPSDVAPPTFSRRGDWLVSARHGIARVECGHGVNYCVHSWEYPGDVWAELIGVRQSLEAAVELIESPSPGRE